MNLLHSGNSALRPAWLAAALFALVAGLSWSPAARADVQQLQTLMQRNNCTACHLIDKRKYGPNFLEVAARYVGKPDAVATLATKIKAGGSGVWGDDVMPPQPLVTDAHARAMAELILTLKP